MRTTQKMTITPPNDMADMVKKKYGLASTPPTAKSFGKGYGLSWRVIAPFRAGCTAKSDQPTMR